MFAHRNVLAGLMIAAALNVATAQPRPTRAELSTTSEWLSRHLNDPDLVILHVGDKAEYEKAHIPGARFASMQDFSQSSQDREKGLVLELLPEDSLRAQLQKFGISDNSRIVVYYGNDWVSPSTRLMLTLDHAGFGSRSGLLDGGMNAWKAAGHPVTAEPTVVKTGKLSPLKTKPVVVDLAFVQSKLNAPGFRIVDARAPVFYDGVEMGNSRKGHVPGAKNIPFTEITNDKLFLKSADELNALFTKAGIGPNDTIIVYCHIGQQGTAIVFAARTLGRNIMLFDGSFQEWGRRTDLAVVNPAEGKK